MMYYIFPLRAGHNLRPARAFNKCRFVKHMRRRMEKKISAVRHRGDSLRCIVWGNANSEDAWGNCCSV